MLWVKVSFKHLSFIFFKYAYQEWSQHISLILLWSLLSHCLRDQQFHMRQFSIHSYTSMLSWCLRSITLCSHNFPRLLVWLRQETLCVTFQTHQFHLFGSLRSQRLDATLPPIIYSSRQPYVFYESLIPPIRGHKLRVYPQPSSSSSTSSDCWLARVRAPWVTKPLYQVDRPWCFIFPYKSEIWTSVVPPSIFRCNSTIFRAFEVYVL